MIGVRWVLATLPLCLSASLMAAPQDSARSASDQDDLAALKKRIAALEEAVLDLRRKVGVQTMIEHVADDLRSRQPRYRTFRLEKGAQIQRPVPAGPDMVKPGDFPMKDVPTDVVDPDTEPVLQVGGTTITRGELEGEIRFAQAFVPGSTDGVIRHVLAKSVLPRATARVLMGDQAGELETRAAGVRQALQSGKSLDEIASSQPGIEVTTLGPFERSEQKLVIAKTAFETDVNEVSPVFFDEYGAHVVKILKKERNVDDAGSPLVVTAQHVFLPYALDGASDSSAIAEKLEQERTNVPITLLDPRYQKAFPKGYPMKTQYKNADGNKQPGDDADMDAFKKR